MEIDDVTIPEIAREEDIDMPDASESVGLKVSHDRSAVSDSSTLLSATASGHIHVGETSQQGHISMVPVSTTNVPNILLDQPEASSSSLKTEAKLVSTDASTIPSSSKGPSAPKISASDLEVCFRPCRNIVIKYSF